MSSHGERCIRVSMIAALGAATAVGCASSKPPPRPAEESFTLSNDSHFPAGHSLAPSSTTTTSAFPMNVNGTDVDSPTGSSSAAPTPVPPTTSYVPAPIPTVADVVPSVAPYKYQTPLASTPFAKAQPVATENGDTKYALPTKGKSFAGLPLGAGSRVVFMADNKLAHFELSFADCKPVLAAFQKKWGKLPPGTGPTWEFKDGFVTIGDPTKKPCVVDAGGGVIVTH